MTHAVAVDGVRDVVTQEMSLLWRACCGGCLGKRSHVVTLERKKGERERELERGLVLRDLWLFPDALLRCCGCDVTALRCRQFT